MTACWRILRVKGWRWCMHPILNFLDAMCSWSCRATTNLEPQPSVRKDLRVVHPFFQRVWRSPWPNNAWAQCPTGIHWSGGSYLVNIATVLSILVLSLNDSKPFKTRRHGFTGTRTRRSYHRSVRGAVPIVYCPNCLFVCDVIFLRILPVIICIFWKCSQCFMNH